MSANDRDQELRAQVAAEHAAKMAVKKVFSILGVDIDRPESVEEFREDLRFGKRMRKAANHGFLAFVGVATVAMVTTAWWAFVDAFQKGGGGG